MYTVNEVFYTLQGEGYWVGRPAVFLRFSGCNLWTGREIDRPSAICNFCDTQFVGVSENGGGKFARAEDLANHIRSFWTDYAVHPYVVCTGGEPLLQLDAALISALHALGFEIAVETNGTLAAPEGVDWICVSPKFGADWVQKTGNELKLVMPQPFSGAQLTQMRSYGFDNFYIQPMEALFDVKETQNNVRLALQFCLENPKWQLSLQTHKILNIP